MAEKYARERPLVGVCLVVRRDGKVLLHKRKGRHAPGTWAFPGGHLEMFEDFGVAALRETAEEAGTDLKVTGVRYWTVANTMYPDEGRHYVVIFMVADWAGGDARVVESGKCECWGWYAWDDLPGPLMAGLRDLKRRGLDPTAF